MGPCLRPLTPALLPLVPGRRGQYLPQRAGSPRGRGARRSDRTDLRQSRNRHRAALHLCRAAGARRALRRCAQRTRCRPGRPCRSLPADDPGSCHRHAGLRPHRRRSLRGVRRFRGERACDQDRRREAQGHRLWLLRHRGEPGHRLQAASGRGDRARAPQAGAVHRRTTARAGGAAHGRPRRDLGRGRGGGGAGGVRARRRDRSPLYPLHLRHHRRSQGHRARQRRAPGGAPLEHEWRLQPGAGPSVVGGVRYRLGGRPLLYRLRAADLWLPVDPLSRASRSAPPTPAPIGG